MTNEPTTHVRVDPERCKGCMLCQDVCPNQLLWPDSQPNQQGFYPIRMIDEAYCINCMRCVDICPDQALLLPDRKSLNWQGLAYWLGKKWQARKKVP